MSPSRRLVAAGLVAGLAIGAPGCGDGAPGGSSVPTSSLPPSSAVPPEGPVAGGEVPAVTVSVDGTLAREGERLAARLTLVNEGEAPVWVPDGYEGAPRSLLLPAAVGDGVVDLGWVVPPTPAGEDVPRMVVRRVAPGESLELEAVDDPPPPEALVDTAGEPVEVASYRLCVDAVADAALPPGASTGADDGVAAVAVDAIEGESTRTCGPTVPV